MSTTLDEQERELRMQLMRADIANKQADTRYKLDLSRWEPWKAMAVAFGAGAGFMAAVAAILALVLRAH